MNSANTRNAVPGLRARKQRLDLNRREQSFCRKQDPTIRIRLKRASVVRVEDHEISLSAAIALRIKYLAARDLEASRQLSREKRAKSSLASAADFAGLLQLSRALEICPKCGLRMRQQAVERLISGGMHAAILKGL